MKVITYLTTGAKLKVLPTRWANPQPLPEGEIIRERNGGNIYTTIIRWRKGDVWQWRAVETNGVNLWWYSIEPDAQGRVIKDSGAYSLSNFEAAPGYEYMVEGLIPLAPDSVDRLVRPDAEVADTLSHWRTMMTAGGQRA